MVTMKDVAKAADVSMATVSRVIAGKIFVKASTYDKVMKAVETLGYELNISARNLSMKKSESIGLVIPSGGCQAPGFHLLIEILIKLSSIYSKTLIIREAALTVEGEENALNFMNYQGCALIIFKPAVSSSKKITSLVSMINSPTVVIDRSVNNAISIWSNYFNTVKKTTDPSLLHDRQQILLVEKSPKDIEKSLEYTNLNTLNVPINHMYELVMTVAECILQGGRFNKLASTEK